MPYKKVPIENKHLYTHWEDTLDLNTQAVNYIDPNAVYDHILTFPIQGTDEDQRIGNKISNVQLRMEYNINLLSKNQLYVPSTITTALNEFLFYKIRIMVVDIPDSPNALNQAAATDFYNDIYSYFQNYQDSSTHQLSLRESSDYTNQFNILFDRRLTLSYRNPTIHQVVNIKLSSCLKFPSSGETIPERHQYHIFFIMPKNYYMDIDSITRSQIDTVYDNVVGTYFNCKVTYSDM